jgi:hypothetical protein
MAASKNHRWRAPARDDSYRRTRKDVGVMTKSITRQIILASRPHGRLQAENFRLEKTEMPAPPGGVLLRVTRARRVKVLVARLVTLLGLSGGGLVYREAIAQEVMGQNRWRMATIPTVLTVEQEQLKAGKPGSDFKECANGCPMMIVVPVGKFTMGSPENESGREASERPQHEVAIAKPFAVSKFDVTFDEWDACVAAAACPRVPDRWGRGEMPVINVSWGDAKQYVGWLSRLTGKEYRLLTEAEWEYVARAGAVTRYSWGDDPGNGNANCDGCGSQWDREQTAPVGS